MVFALISNFVLFGSIRFFMVDDEGFDAFLLTKRASPTEALIFGSAFLKGTLMSHAETYP